MNIKYRPDLYQNILINALTAKILLWNIVIFDIIKDI